MVVVNKKRRTFKIIDFAVPGDTSTYAKEKEKIEKKKKATENLKRETKDYIINCGLFRSYT